MPQIEAAAIWATNQLFSKAGSKDCDESALYSNMSTNPVDTYVVKHFNALAF